MEKKNKLCILKDISIEDIKKFVEVDMWHVVDGAQFGKERDQEGFKSWVKIIAMNGVFILKQLMNKMFPTPKLG